MQVLLLLYEECEDKLEKFVRRLLHAIIKCRLCQMSHPIPHTCAFDYLPSSFRRKRAKDAPTPEAGTELTWNDLARPTRQQITVLIASAFCACLVVILCKAARSYLRCFEHRITCIRLTGWQLVADTVYLVFSLVGFSISILSLRVRIYDESNPGLKFQPG